MAIKIGISPIAWQNDDLPDLTADYSMEQALEESRQIGYLGVERGQRMPQDTDGLGQYLNKYDIALCGGWCSGNTLVNDLEAEIASVKEQVEQFIALKAPCIVYAECSNTIQGQLETPLETRVVLDKDEIRTYALRLTELAKWMADQGMPMAYHHHMGTIIQSEDDINWLMEYSGSEVNLCFDTGHLFYDGGDLIATMDRWGDRIFHVHFKDIRPDVVKHVFDNKQSFLDGVIAGAFTVPGDGCIDFHGIGKKLATINYDGWIVVEAEQDPKKAPPMEYSKKGYEHIQEVLKASSLEWE